MPSLKNKKAVVTIDPVHEYYKQIEDGTVIVSNKVRAVYKELVRVMGDSNSEWEYDSDKASRAVSFIEKFCRQSKGKYGGKKLTLELWEKALISATFGFVHKITGFRRFRDVFLVVGRKNGKSTLSASVGLYLMIADHELGAEIYACATKKDQAKIIWLEAKRMVKKSPSLRKKIQPKVAEMVADSNDSIFKPLGADSDTQDGLNVHGALLDEVHAWKTNELFDVIVDGETSREQPLNFITTTAGMVRESVYDRLYDESCMAIDGYENPDGFHDDTILPVIYELDKRDEWTNRAMWQKANPSLGTIKSREALEVKVSKAEVNALLVKNLLCKDFCVRETSTEAWLTFEELNNTDTFDIKKLKPSYGIGGVDLSSTNDLTSAKMIFKVPDDKHIYVLSQYWIPEDLLEQKVNEDKIPYDIWAKQGYVELIPDNKIHPKYVTQWFDWLYETYDLYPAYVGYDAWSASYWVEEMADHFGKENMIAVHQGKKTLSAPMQCLHADLASKIINYNNNPIDKWCLSNTSVDVDRNGNIQPHKGLSRIKRIDGTASLLDAYTILYNHESEYMSQI
jgi:phage terminase large subunit-like protein